MKTIRVGNARTRNKWTMLLMAALGGLYYHRKSGGNYRGLIDTAVSKFSGLRNQIGRVAPSVGSRIGSDSMVGSKTSSDVSSAYQPSTTV